MARGYRYKMAVMIDLRAVSSVRDTLDPINELLGSCDPNLKLRAEAKLMDVEITAEKMLTPDELRILHDNTKRAVKEINEKHGIDHRVEAPRFDGVITPLVGSTAERN